MIAALQHRSAKSQARNQAVIRVDRDNLAQPPEHADERVGGDHAPIGSAQLTEAKRRRNHLRVEVTEVIGDEHERLFFREVSETFDPQAKPGPHQRPVERIEPGGHSGRHGPVRLEPAFLFGAEHLLRIVQ